MGSHIAKWKTTNSEMAEALCPLHKAYTCFDFMHVRLFCDPMGCSSPGSSVHGIYQARILEWAVISFSGGSYWTRVWTHDSYRLVLCTNNFSWNYENGLCFKSEFWFLCLWAEAAIESSGALEPDWGFGVHHPSYGASLIAQSVKNLPAVQETWVRSLGWEDPLEKEMATHSSILAWKIPWTEEPGGLQSMGSQRVGTTEQLTLQLQPILWLYSGSDRYVDGFGSERQSAWRTMDGGSWHHIGGSDQNYHTSCAHFTC